MVKIIGSKPAPLITYSNFCVACYVDHHRTAETVYNGCSLCRACFEEIMEIKCKKLKDKEADNG